MRARSLRMAWLGALVLVVATAASGSGHAQDHSQLTVTVNGGAPLQASASLRIRPADSPRPASDVVILRVLDSRGLASGWTVILVTHGMFRVAPVDPAELPGRLGDEITILQGNRDLGGQSVLVYGSPMPPDSVLWSASRHFGDGEYALTLRGTIVPHAEPETLTLTICGSSP